MKTFSALAALAALPLLASAHFILDYPTTRGFDEDLEPQFCGGFNSTSSTRVPFPLSGSAPVTIGSHHPSADVAILISFDENPTSFADFNETSSGQSYGLLKDFGTITGTGDFCFNVDIASLGVTGLQNGSVATLQVEYNGGDGILLQCSDLVLVSDYTAPSNVSCTNATATATTSGGESATGSVAPSSTGGSSGAMSGKTVGAAVLGAAAAVVGAVAMC
ncbi:hypothetical protein JCM8097_001516 [Rhodosporidiobolus ruineniae]